MPKRIRRYQTDHKAGRPTLKRFLPAVKYTGYFLGTVIVALTLYELFFLVRLTAGISAEKETPEDFVWLEIVDASGISHAAERIADEIKAISDEQVDIQVVNRTELNDNRIAKSLIISRERDLRLARIVALRLGLDESEVVYRPPLENDDLLTLTLVLGENIQELLKSKSLLKET